MKTNMNERERKRLSEQAVELSKAFADLANVIEDNEVIPLTLNLLRVSVMGPSLVQELAEILKGSVESTGELHEPGDGRPWRNG